MAPPIKRCFTTNTQRRGAMTKYSTRSVYLGIDVHKKTYSVTAVAENTVLKQTSMPASPEALLSFIQRFFPEDHIFSAYEAGFSGFSLHRTLIDNGINNIVVHAASIEVAVNNKCKTDKRDSKKIAMHLFQGKLKSVHIPTIQRENWRAVTRLRLQFVKNKTRVACQIKGMLFCYNLLPHTHNGKTSKKWLKSLLNLKGIDKDVFFSLQSQIQLWLYLDKEIKQIDKRLKIQAREDYEVGNTYMENHGIGLISSRILANELGDLSQFNSESGLSSFTGLTPKEYSSGDNRRLGNISRQGNPIIRGILTEAAWKTIKKDPQLGEVFDRIVRNTGSRKKAILGIARRMIGHTRAKFKYKRQESYVLG